MTRCRRRYNGVVASFAMTLASVVRLTVLTGIGAAALLHAQRPAATTQLVIVVDGLRPDYVTPEVMPRLYGLGQRGVVFRAHHSVFPTVTRVNASSFVTGTYPETHGLLGNTIYIPAANATQGLDTGRRENLESVARAVGQLLTAPTLGDILAREGRRLLAVSSGSTGSSFLLNDAAAANGGAIIHTDYTVPPELGARVLKRLGPAPAHAIPNDGQNQRAIDAYLTIGLDEIHPDITFMWINDPDETAHVEGIGSDLTRRALSLVDGGIGRIEDTLRARGLFDRTNILVTSDHGFSTHTGTLKLESIVEPFVQTLPDGSKDIVIAEGAIHFRTPDAARVAAVVAALQRRPEVGAIFTRAGSRGPMEGVVPGTLSFDVARWSHARSGDVLVSANWTDEANEAGYHGKTTQNGVAGHGSSSPYDIHNTLIAIGPDFREHVTSDVPTGNVDIAPTLLWLVGVRVPPTMTGRVMGEALRQAPQRSVTVDHVTETVNTPEGGYELTAHLSAVDGYRYLDFTDVTRR
jgi:predicted AlkP superfamily pyrophosphatase or phosphodiesterase